MLILTSLIVHAWTPLLFCRPKCKYIYILHQRFHLHFHIALHILKLKSNFTCIYYTNKNKLEVQVTHQYCTSISLSHRQASRATISILPSTAVSSSSSPMTSIQDLHVDLLIAIFEHLGVLNLCKVEKGSSVFLLKSSCYRGSFLL